MFDAFVGTVLMFLMIIGTVAIGYIIMLKLLIPKNRSIYYIIFPCDKNDVDVRKKAYGMRIKLNLLGEGLFSKIIVLDLGITENEKADLIPICKESNGIYLVNNENLKDYFDGRI